MDKTEATKILAILKAAYPNSYKDTELAHQAVAVWTDMFADTPAKHVGMAVKALIATCKFPPTIAEVKEYIQKLTEPEQMDASQAWILVKKALHGPDVHYREFGWDYSGEFNKLPPEVQSVLGNAVRLRMLEEMDELDRETYERPRFIRSFEARQKADLEYGRLPQSVREESALISGDDSKLKRLISKAMMIGTGEE